jgi:ribosome-binding factor A
VDPGFRRECDVLLFAECGAEMPRRYKNDYSGATRSDRTGGMRPATQRQLRVGEELRHALAQLLRPGMLRDPALREANVTVVEVRVSPDLRNATAFVMPLAGGNADQVMAGLKRSAVFLKGQVARTVELRQVPNIVFALDGAFDNAARIAALLARPEVERDLHTDPPDQNLPEPHRPDNDSGK